MLFLHPTHTAAAAMAKAEKKEAKPKAEKKEKPEKKVQHAGGVQRSGCRHQLVKAAGSAAEPKQRRLALVKIACC
jgi:hypothetical protein